MNALDFTAVLLCDDVRKEVTNKDILIGVYGGDILVESFPRWIKMAIWMEISPKETGAFPLTLKLTFSDNAPLLIDMKLQVRGSGTSSIAVPGMELLVEKEGELTLEIKEGESWQVLKRKKGAPRQSNATASTASERRSERWLSAQLQSTLWRAPYRRASPWTAHPCPCRRPARRRSPRPWRCA
jgi:uncharacterized protein DUF6941